LLKFREFLLLWHMQVVRLFIHIDSLRCNWLWSSHLVLLSSIFFGLFFLFFYFLFNFLLHQSFLEFLMHIDIFLLVLSNLFVSGLRDVVLWVWLLKSWFLGNHLCLASLFVLGEFFAVSSHAFLNHALVTLAFRGGLFRSEVWVFEGSDVGHFNSSVCWWLWVMLLGNDIWLMLNWLLMMVHLLLDWGSVNTKIDSLRYCHDLRDETHRFLSCRNNLNHRSGRGMLSSQHKDWELLSISVLLLELIWRDKT